eukprot:1194871-Prorocentrum_minimum.AAC.10
MARRARSLSFRCRHRNIPAPPMSTPGSTAPPTISPVISASYLSSPPPPPTRIFTPLAGDVSVVLVSASVGSPLGSLSASASPSVLLTLSKPELLTPPSGPTTCTSLGMAMTRLLWSA